LVIDLIKLKLTWGNKRVGGDRVAKRLDKFLLPKGLLNDHFIVMHWLSSGGESSHFSILLEMGKVGKKPPNPFKFNPSWLENEVFINIVKENQISLKSSKRETMSI
jgi:hypothetical protein